MRAFVAFLVLVLTLPVTAVDKGTVTLEITVPDSTPADAGLAIGAAFNGWDPVKGKYGFVRAGNGNFIGKLPAMDAGAMIIFKVTRGSWDSVEVAADGSDIADRRYRVQPGEQRLAITVEAWRDQADIPPPAPTAIVPIIHRQVELPTFGGPRDLYIYLPSDYQTSGKRYPVIYMTDGSNLFDQSVGATTEWGMDELMEQYVADGSSLASIVVGINHAGQNRAAEYSPWAIKWQALGEEEGKGAQFADWMADSLKPMIDGEFRTKPEREHTTIMGSSMGGLISCYTALRHQDVFSKAGCYSPAFLKGLVGENLLDFIRKTGRHYPMRIHMDMGDGELDLFGPGILDEMQEVLETMLESGFSADEVRYQMIPDGIHHEANWRARTPEILDWLNGEGE